MNFLYRLREKYEYHRFRFFLYLKEREEISRIIRVNKKCLDDMMFEVNKYICGSQTDYQKNFYLVEYCFLESNYRDLMNIWREIIRFPSYEKILDIIKELRFFNNKMRTYIKRSLDDYYYDRRDFFYNHLYDSNRTLDIIKKCIDNDNLVDYLK